VLSTTSVAPCGGPASPAPRGPGPPAWDSRWSPGTGFAWARRRGQLHGRGVRGIHERGRDTGAGEDRGEEAARRAVERARRDDPIPGGHLRATARWIAAMPVAAAKPARHRAGPRTPPPTHRRSGCPAARTRTPAAGRWSPRPARPRRRSRTCGLVDRDRRGRLVHPRDPRGRPDRARREAVVHRRIVHRYGRPTASPAGPGAAQPSSPIRSCIAVRIGPTAGDAGG